MTHSVIFWDRFDPYNLAFPVCVWFQVHYSVPNSRTWNCFELLLISASFFWKISTENSKIGFWGNCKNGCCKIIGNSSKNYYHNTPNPNTTSQGAIFMKKFTSKNSEAALTSRDNNLQKLYRLFLWTKKITHFTSETIFRQQLTFTIRKVVSSKHKIEESKNNNTMTGKSIV